MVHGSGVSTTGAGTTWASNSDAGWGAWCTLTGWIQSWIVTTQAQIQQRENFWDVTKTPRSGNRQAP